MKAWQAEQERIRLEEERRKREAERQYAGEVRYAAITLYASRHYVQIVKFGFKRGAQMDRWNMKGADF